MYTYAYQARDNSGKISAGIQDAINEENAINSLMRNARKSPRSRKPTSSSLPGNSPPWSTPAFRSSAA
jgi:type II secretory pathway component PulF